MEFPVEVFKQFLTSRRVTLAVRCTCKEYQYITGSGWLPYWDFSNHRFVSDDTVINVDDDLPPYMYRVNAKEYILASMGDRHVYCGNLTYKTDIDDLGAAVGKATSGPLVYSTSLSGVDGIGNTYNAVVTGSTKNELVDKITLIRSVLIPAQDGKFCVSILKFMVAETWEWSDD